MVLVSALLWGGINQPEHQVNSLHIQRKCSYLECQPFLASEANFVVQFPHTCVRTCLCSLCIKVVFPLIITHHLIVYQLDTFTCLKMWLTVNMSECPPGISSLLKNQRIIQGATYTMTMVLCQILCLSAMVTCKDVFLLISFFTFIINHCTTLNGNQHRMGVILYMKIHPLLYWCYTVESLVNKKLMQLPVIQSLLPHTLF